MIRRMFTVGMLCGLAACSPFGSDNDPSPEQALRESRERWAARGFQNYDLTLHMSVSLQSVTDAVVRVRNETKVAVVDPTTGAPLPKWPPDVLQLFEGVEVSIERGDDLFVRYDGALGFPTEIRVNPDDVGDGRWLMTVVAITPTSAPVANEELVSPGS